MFPVIRRFSSFESNEKKNATITNSVHPSSEYHISGSVLHVISIFGHDFMSIEHTRALTQSRQLIHSI